MVTDQEIARGVETVLRQSDPNGVTTLNGVVQQLEAQLGQDLTHKAGFIREHISLLLRSNPPPLHKDHFTPHNLPQFTHFPQFPHNQPSHFQHQFQHHHHHQLQQQQQQQQHQMMFRQHPVQPTQVPVPPPLQIHKRETNSAKAKESAPAGTKRKGGAGGLNKVCGVSPELQAIVGEPKLSRTEIVKALWAYIRKNNLQDPSNKRKIICDEALSIVFETDETDMFKMNKLLSKHILPLGPTKETTQAKRAKVDVESVPESSESSGPSGVRISEALAKFLGTEEKEMLQLDAMRRVWEYIKANKLEDPVNPMAILCDEKLRELVGCESISSLGMSEMLVSRHLSRQ